MCTALLPGKRMTDPAFFAPDCTLVAPKLIGKLLCRQTETGVLRLRISQTEAYRGRDDTACHAFKGRTPRNEPLYMGPGTVYVYLCYGMHNLLNLITGAPDDPQGVLLRACLAAPGPGILTKRLQIDRSFNRQNIFSCPQLWLEDDGFSGCVVTAPRVGIAYAQQKDIDRPWRFILQEQA